MKTSGVTYSVIDRNSILKKIEEIKKSVELKLYLISICFMVTSMIKK